MKTNDQWCPMCAAYTDHGSGACPQLAKQPEARVKELEGAFHLLPIAEAGPVPEGMIRLYAHRIPLGPPSAEFWSAFSEPGEEDTHCVDIHPPKQ